MIIPPDPEKDPNLFNASSSTPSLLHAPSEYDDTTSRWDGDHDTESLPPYEGRRRSRVSIVSDDEDVFADSNAAPGHVVGSSPYGQYTRASGERAHDSRLPGLTIPAHPQRVHVSQLPHSSSSPISSTGSLTPTASRPSVLLPRFNASGSTTLNHSNGEASTSKLWESSSTKPEGSSSRAKGKRVCGIIPPPSEGFRRWWKRWRRWAQVVIVIVLVGIGLTVGLLVGMRQNRAKSDKYPKGPPWMDKDTDGKRVATWSGNGSYNLTYVESRDNPSSTDGNLTDCNVFQPLNMSSSPFNTLFTPFPYSTISLVSFSFPLSSSDSPPSDLFVKTQGLGSTGTTTFLGVDGPEQLITSGVEGKILIDVIVRYAGAQELDTMMRVCKMTRGDSGVGVGIYSPKETDGKMSNPYKIDPALVPTHQVVIRLPPSMYSSPTSPLYIPSFSIESDRMIVRFGDLTNVASFGDLKIDSARGGVQVKYAEAERTTVISYIGDVSGRWNVSESLIVNVTDGSIASDIILYDPSTFDNTTVLPPTTDYTVVPRSPAAYPSADPEPSPDDGSSESDDSSNADSTSDDEFEHEINSLFNSTTPNTTNSSSHTITTNLFTSEGSVKIRYLHQPSTIELSAIVATQSGDIDLDIHPSYVGPFLAKTSWGDINMPSPRPINQYDPLGRNRMRELIIGAIDVQQGSAFATVGYNKTILEGSTDTISGIVYWADVKKNGTVVTQTLQTVQSSQDSAGSELVILGGFGNVDVRFDGQ
ncbi:hypothetical protein I316_06792 [Kwoniella heveanensis BCC8398]|uniref:Uncharacterized protein n=1 Tax=Kwoniella heveanensis BCC8398 TaxID=1296120 RepID=A0A1B9GKV5_9TREE|nr:hypothetical protein I316_06792 [Kwoniella heveanensis BCC8398]